MDLQRRRYFGGLVFLVLGCSPPSNPPPDAGPEECQGVPARTLDQLFPSYFAATAPTGCVTGCHGVGLGSLKFTTAAELWQATNGKSSVSGDGPLVTPFFPSSSWLFQKLKESAASPMPQGGPFLTAAQLTEVQGWICAGAPPPSGAGGGGGGTGGGTGGGAATLGVSSFNPTSGLVGTAVTVQGQGFSAIASQNLIKFNGIAAAALTASSTTLTTHVPAGASTGPISVTVGTATATSASTFTLMNGNAVPVIQALSPCGKVAGASSFSLTVTGLNFLAGSTITFNGVSLAVTSSTATQLTATVPATALATAPAGNSAQVIVSNPPPGGGAARAAVFGVASAVSTLAASVQTLLLTNCGSSGCHTSAAQAGGLVLSAGTLRANLVGVPSAACSGRLLVTECNPARASSVLIDKILATPQSPACSGTAMPKGAPLSAAEKQKLVDWVAQGAP